MNIAINCRILNERLGGPFRYTLNLIRELAEIDKENHYFLLLPKDFQFNFELPENFKKVILKTHSRIIFDYWHIPRFSHRSPIDFFIFPKNTFGFFVKGKKLPVFHDIIYYEKNLPFKEFKFFDHLHHTLMIRYAKNHSFLNIAVSHFTAERMKTLLKIPENKICVFTEGVESSFQSKIGAEKKSALIEKYGLKLPFLFYSGSLSPRKNMLNVLKAFLLIQNEIPHNIYFTAGYSWKDNEIIDFIKKNHLEQRVIKLGHLSEEELAAMYQLADLYLYPSLYEGFGLPILEAQACGCPVLTSSLTSCPEIAGEGALLVNPYDFNEMAQGIQAVIDNPELKNQLIQRGFENYQRYSWKKMAENYLELFR